MQVMYLPGFSLKNKAELEAFEKYFREMGAEFYSHQWSHWEDESIEWNVENEFSRIEEIISKNNLKNFVLIAKSIGTYVGSKFVHRNSENIEKIRFMGIPVKDSDEEFLQTYKDALVNFEFVKIFQNEFDKYGSFEEIEKFLGDYENIELEKIPNVHTHEYFIPEVIWKSL